LPQDLIKLEKIACSKYDNGPWRPMRLATGNFNIKPDLGDKDFMNASIDESV